VPLHHGGADAPGDLLRRSDRRRQLVRVASPNRVRERGRRAAGSAASGVKHDPEKWLRFSEKIMLKQKG